MCRTRQRWDGGAVRERRLRIAGIALTCHGRLVVSWVVSCLVSCLASCDRARQPTQQELPYFGPEDVKMSLGVADVYYGALKSQLRLRLHNRGADFRGEILVRGLLTPLSTAPGAAPPSGMGPGVGVEPLFDPVSYRLETELPRDTNREFSFPVCANGWEEIQVDLLQGEYETLFRSPPLSATPTRLSVLVIGTTSPNLRHLESRLEDSFGPRAAPGSVAFTVVHPRELPPLACGYTGFQAVVLYDTSLRGESPESFEALEGWVRRGGTLIIFPGNEWDSSAAPQLLELAGVAPVQGVNASMDGLVKRLSLPSSNVSIATLEPRGAVVRNEGLYYERRLGCGVVRTSAVTPVGPVFPDEPEAPALYGWLKGSLLRGLSPAASPDRNLASWDESALDYLQRRAGLRVPSASTLASLLLTYFVCGLLIPAAYFKRRGRREWTFVCVVAAAVLTSFGIYRFGVLTYGQQAKVGEISLARLHADGRGAEVTTFLGVTSPRRDRFSPQSGRSPTPVGPLLDAFAQPLHTLRWNAVVRPELLRGREIAIDGGRTHHLPISLRPNSLESFRVEYCLVEQDILSVEPDAEDGAVRVTNHSSHPIDAFAMFEGSIRLEERIPSRSTLTLSLAELRNRGQEVRLNERRTAKGLVRNLARWSNNATRLHADLQSELPGTLFLISQERVFPMEIEDYERTGECVFVVELPPAR